MRPIKLTIKAFGPYAGEQDLDFRILNDKSLFLIHGPTGSGKTTILDAITFALYGRTSGDERNPKEMRSDHADPSIPTEITFDFSLGKEIYRITRRPEQERIKKRGEGRTTEKAQATLWKRTHISDGGEDGTVITSKETRVTEKIEELLGFRAEQFRQVVVLPQGKFMKLLMAGSKEKEDILEALFKTEMYRRIEEVLKENARTIAEQIKDTGRTKEIILDQASASSTEDLLGRCNALELQITEINERLKDARKKESLIKQQLDEGRKINDKIKEREASESNLELLEKRSGEFHIKRGRLGMARKALTLSEAEVALSKRIGEAKNAEKSLEKASLDVETAKLARQKSEEKLQKEREREPDQTQLQEEITILSGLIPKIREIEEARKEFELAEKSYNELAEKKQKILKVLEDCKNGIDIREKETKEKELLTSQIPLLERTKEDLDKKNRQREQLEQVMKSLIKEIKVLEGLQNKFDAIDIKLKIEKEELEELMELWSEGQASILAQQLVPEQPCPVCGSMEHPSPAVSIHELPTEAAINNKRANVKIIESEWKTINKDLSEHKPTIAGLQSDIRALEETLGEWTHKDLSELTLQIDKVKISLIKAKEAEKRIIKIGEEILSLKGKEIDLNKNIEDLNKSLTGATERKSRAKALVDEREGTIPDKNLCDINSLNKLIQDKNSSLSTLKGALKKAQDEAHESNLKCSACEATLESAGEKAREAMSHKDLEEKTFERRLREAGFGNKVQYQEAKLTSNENEIDILDEEIRKFEGDLQAARERFNRAIESAQNVEPVNIELLEQEYNKIKEDIEGLITADTTLKNQKVSVSNWLRQLDNIKKELERLEREYNIAGQLANVASGRNPYGITFQRFVLSSLLDDVLLVASKRLQMMSKGRFNLQRTITRSDQRVTGGLDLEIYDSYTGTNRPVSSLSGGESFLASLSLALGLSDVVQSYAGGVQLETIFIDEGFGSLDSEALDCALKALIDLRQGGRLVGIISHVPELKERIDVRLEVIADKKGSVARFAT